MDAMPPAGWYPDPDDPQSGKRRFWDGSEWTDRYTRAGGQYSRAAWIGALALLALPATLFAIRQRNEPAAEATGSVFALVVIGAVVALAMRFIYVRWLHKGSAMSSPWTVIIAGVISLLLLPGMIERDQEEDRDELVEEFADTKQECDAVAAEEFPPLPAPLAYRALGPERQDLLADVLPPGLDEAFHARAITRDAGTAGFLLAVPVGDDPEAQADALESFLNASEDAGASQLNVRLADGTDLAYVELADTLASMTADDCYARAIYAYRLADLREIVEAIPH